MYARHLVSCAMHDPTPGRCDCGARFDVARWDHAQQLLASLRWAMAFVPTPTADSPSVSAIHDEFARNHAAALAAIAAAEGRS